MGDGEPVHAEDLVEPRASRHQDELDEREVRPEQGGQLADRRELAAERGQLVESAVTEPHGEDEHAVGDEHRDDLRGTHRPGAWQRDRARRSAGHRLAGHGSNRAVRE